LGWPEFIAQPVETTGGATPGGRGQALPPTDWQCRVRCMRAARCAKAGRGTTGREAMICAARKRRCVCEAQARGRKRDSRTDQHDGDLWHMCRRTTGERRWEDQVRRLDTAAPGTPRKRDRTGSAKAPTDRKSAPRSAFPARLRQCCSSGLWRAKTRNVFARDCCCRSSGW
jgi:hypothetical protein